VGSGFVVGGGGGVVNWNTYKGWDDYQRFLSNPFHQMYVDYEVHNNNCFIQ